MPQHSGAAYSIEPTELIECRLPYFAFIYSRSPKYYIFHFTWKFRACICPVRCHFTQNIKHLNSNMSTHEEEFSDLWSLQGFIRAAGGGATSTLFIGQLPVLLVLGFFFRYSLPCANSKKFLLSSSFPLHFKGQRIFRWIPWLLLVTLTNRSMSLRSRRCLSILSPPGA